MESEWPTLALKNWPLPRIFRVFSIFYFLFLICVQKKTFYTLMRNKIGGFSQKHYSLPYHLIYVVTNIALSYWKPPLYLPVQPTTFFSFIITSSRFGNTNIVLKNERIKLRWRRVQSIKLALWFWTFWFWMLFSLFLSVILLPTGSLLSQERLKGHDDY